MPTKVSIITPVYNRVTWLREALESALNQTYPNIEIVLIDDGSENKEAEWIASSYPGVQYYWQPNQGLGAARNSGIQRSSGEFLAFLDDDDWLTPEAIMDKVQILKDHADVGVVYSDLYIVNKDNSIIGRFYAHRKLPPPSGNLYRELLPSNFIPPVSLLWRRELIDEVGGFPDWSGAEDWYVLIKAAERTLFQYLDTIHGGYRIHDTNMTRIVSQQTRGYTRIQEEVIGTKKFLTLPLRYQSKVLCHYAVLQMMSGDPALASKYLRKARELSPGYLLPFLLRILTLFGRTIFQKIVHIFRFIRYRFRPIPSSTSIFMGYE